MATRTFQSADGSTRCRGCHLHPDQCTCDPMHPLWRALGGGRVTTDDQDRAFEDVMMEHASAGCALREDGSLYVRADGGARELVIDRDGEVLSDTARGDVLREGAWS